MQEKNEAGENKEIKDKLGNLIPAKLTKSNCLILVLLGILLLVIVWPTGQSADKAPYNSFATESPRSAIKQEVQVLSEPVAVNEMQQYTLYLEESLGKLLSTIEGAGKVEVMITLESSKETIVEKDKTTVRAGTTEVDSAGGSRNTSDISDSEETLYMGDEGSGDAPYVKKIISPRISGVVVSAQGGNSPQIVMSITEAIQVLFGIDAHKIKIVKMIS